MGPSALVLTPSGGDPPPIVLASLRFATPKLRLAYTPGTIGGGLIFRVG